MQSFKNKLIFLFKNFFTPKEIIFTFALLLISVFSILVFVYKASTLLLVDRIIYTGHLSEGIIESPLHSNPYKAESQVDRDVAKLLFSSLIRNLDGEKFDLGLAQSVEVNSDKSIYKVTLRPNIYFSNGKPITADEVIYSFSNIPLEKNYEVSKEGENVLIFNVRKVSKDSKENFLETFTYPIISQEESFSTNLSTTLITSSYFKIIDVVKDSDGNIQRILLERYNNGEIKLPYIKTYAVNFYKNEEEAYSAFQRKEIDLVSGIRGNTISKIKDDTDIVFEVSPLPNNFAVFINQNRSEVLRDPALRQAMSDILDRESLTNQVLGSFGIPEKNILGENEKAKSAEEVLKTLPSSFFVENGVLYMGTKKGTAKTSAKENSSTTTADKVEVKVSLTTIENLELIETAKFIQTAWKKIGIQTEIKIIGRNELNTVVRDRDFENLLFGFSIKNARDYYSFFSSKERNYPKLNISNYTSKEADKILDVLVNENDETRKTELLKKLSEEISEDNPVIILYKPQFVFAHFQKMHITLTKTIKAEEDRYTFINNWYTDTEKVFKVFNNLILVDKLDTWLY